MILKEQFTKSVIENKMVFYKKAAVAFSVCMLSATIMHAQVKHKSVAGHSGGLKASIANGQLVYTRICASCHHADGAGVPNMNPPLIKTTYVLGAKKKLISIVLNGFNESVEINGDTYSNVMASHSYLKDAEIADVLTYVRNSFGNKASAVTALEVKKLRAAKK
jgi:mono/diheme cytochrome c family protein